MEDARKKKEKFRIEKLISKLQPDTTRMPTDILVKNLVSKEKKKRSLITYEKKPTEINEMPKELFTNDFETRN